MPYAATIPEPTSRTLAGKSNAFSSTPPVLGIGCCCLGACCCLAAFCCCLAAFCSCLAALRAALSSGLCCAIVGAAPATITMVIMKPTLITIARRLTEILPPPAVCRFNSNLHSYPLHTRSKGQVNKVRTLSGLRHTQFSETREPLADRGGNANVLGVTAEIL